MKRLKAISNREWVHRCKPEKIGKGRNCPRDFGLDNNCAQFGCCADCWDSTAKRNGKYIMKVVKE